MGDMADMIVDMWLDEEYVFDRYAQMHGMGNQRREKRASFEILIKNNENLGVWQTNDGRKIPFEELDSKHIKNIYTFLKEREIYIPSYIRLFKDGKPNALEYMIRPTSLAGQQVLVMPKDVGCHNCPVRYFDSVDDEGYGSNSYQCSLVDGHIDDAVKLKLKHPGCPINKVR